MIAEPSSTAAEPAATPSSGSSQTPDVPSGLYEFVNPIAEGADPCVVKDGDRYLWSQSEGNVGVAIWESDRLTGLGTKHVVWEAPSTGPYSKEVWAPELIRLDGGWYIYVAASDGDNRNHRAYVLAADTADPLGSYTLHGPLFTGDGTDPEAENLWAIDMTVLEHQGKNYALWSGYLQTDGPHQHLFISPMADPVTLAGPRVRLFRPTDYSWERSTEQPGLPAIDEAPQVLTQGGRIFVAYSCGSALLPSYKLGLLELTGDDPLELSSWRKFPQPVFTSSDSTYGVGHGGYVRSPDGSQWWHIYHAKMDPEFGFRRAIFAQPFTWSADDAPVLGEPVPPNEPLAVPAGTPIHPVDHAQSWDLTDGRSSTADFDYYGHHQFIDHDQTGVHLGIVPAVPINDYRSGEKLVLRDGVYGDARVTAVFRFVEGDRDVGLLFRASSPAVGFDAERGYLAAISPARGGVVLGKMDGAGWHELAWTTLPIDVDQPQRLTVEAMGRQIKVMVGDGNGDDAVLVAEDADYSVGSVGVRVLDTHAAFESLSVHPLL